MQSPSQPDATIRELRSRMGEDVGLLSYLPDEKVNTAPFHNFADSGGYPLPARILFGKLKQDKSSPRRVWALLHNKPGSSRPPEWRLKIFSRLDQLEGPITLDEAMEQASPMPAFTCLNSRHGRWDRAHLCSVLRYYFILQKLQLPSPWPISDVFICELKAACRVAKVHVEESVLKLKDQKAVTPVTARPPGASMRSQDPAPSRVTHDSVYTVGHKAIKGSRPGSAVAQLNSQEQRASASKKSADAILTPDHKKLSLEDEQLSLPELLFAEAAEASLSNQGRAPSSAEDTGNTPGMVITSYRNIFTEKEVREKRLVDDLARQVILRSELEGLEEEAKTLKTSLLKSKAELKRLRTSLSTRDLAFIQLGQDLAHEASKRVRFEASGEE